MIELRFRGGIRSKMRVRVQFWVTTYQVLWDDEVDHAEVEIDTDNRVDGSDTKQNNICHN